MSKIEQVFESMKRATAAKEISCMMIITIITQIISVYKSAIIAANFGVCVELDAYNFANNLSTFFLTFVSAGITTVVIPAYIKKLDKKALDTFLTVVFGVTGFFLFGTYLLRGQLVDILTSRDMTFRTYVCSIMLLTILIQALPAVLGVTSAYYQCVGKFNLPKIILLVSNIITTFMLVILKDFDLYQYLYILLSGAIFQFVVDLLCAVRLGFRFRIELQLKNETYKSLMRIFIPTLFSTGIYRINTMIDSLISSNLGTGKLTILTYSNTIVGMINVLIIGNLITYVYPKIVEAVSFGKRKSQKILWEYATVFHIVVCLIVIGFISVGREFIGLLYEHGEFSSQAASAVYICMTIYVFDQQNNIVRDLIYRYFFAHGDTKITVKNGIITSTVNIVFSFLLSHLFGVYGIILGTFVAGLVSLCSIVLRFKKTYGFQMKMKSILINFFKTELAVFVTIVLVFILKKIMPSFSYILSFLIYGIISLVIYISCIFIVHKKLLMKYIKR